MNVIAKICNYGQNENHQPSVNENKQPAMKHMFRSGLERERKELILKGDEP